MRVCVMQQDKTRESAYEAADKIVAQVWVGVNERERACVCVIERECC